MHSWAYSATKIVTKNVQKKSCLFTRITTRVCISVSESSMSIFSQGLLTTLQRCLASIQCLYAKLNGKLSALDAFNLKRSS